MLGVGSLSYDLMYMQQRLGCRGYNDKHRTMWWWGGAEGDTPELRIPYCSNVHQRTSYAVCRQRIGIGVTHLYGGYRISGPDQQFES